MLREEIKSRGWGCSREIALATGIPLATISDFVSGKTQNLGFDRAQKIGEYLGFRLVAPGKRKAAGGK
jgi:plasmid maintenance system antidote protein VapI